MNHSVYMECHLRVLNVAHLPSSKQKWESSEIASFNGRYIFKWLCFPFFSIIMLVLWGVRFSKLW